MSDQKFTGFILPKANYFRLPNNWTDITHDMTSMSEMKIVEYVLRHTWGYNGEEEKPKRISTNEFANGRKKKDGKRMDRGTGLSTPSIVDGCKRAVAHGFLKVDEDRRDLGRIKRYYSLMLEGEETPRTRVQEVGDLEKESFTGSKEDLPRSQESLYRSRKDNLGKTTKTEENIGKPTLPSKSRKSPKVKKLKEEKERSSKFDRRAAAELRVLLDEQNIVKLKRAKIETLARQVRRLREEGGATEERIRDAIIWWRKNYGTSEFVPSLQYTKDIFDKFDKIERQMKFQQNGTFRFNGKRITRDNMHDNENCEHGIPRVWVGHDGKQYDGLLLDKVRRNCRKQQIEGLPTKQEVDEVLAEMGEKIGSFPLDVIGRL